MEAGQALVDQPGPGVRAKKKARDRLIRLAAAHPDWVLGFQDETWWSRLARPDLHAWAGDEPLRLHQLDRPAGDTAPKALCCYGLLRADTDEVLLRFVDGRPVSQVTEDFLGWVCGRLRADGKRALLLVWDNAAWHVSQRVRAWIKEHNRQAKRDGGVRIISCHLPIKAPWLNRIEPCWIHAKRAVVEADRVLTKDEIIGRVYDHFGTERVEPLVQQVA